MKWNEIEIEVVERTEDNKFPIIKLLEPMYTTKKFLMIDR